MRHVAAWGLVLGLVLGLGWVGAGVAAARGQQDGPAQEARPSAGRVAFERFAARHDANHDGKIEREEFRGSAALFNWLDQDGNGVVTAEEFAKRAESLARRGAQAGWGLPRGVTALRDLEYAQVDGKSLRLDLYLPERSATKPPLLVWIHGGGWTAGSKAGVNPCFLRLTGEGYAVASSEYRLAGLATHPRQIHDCKGAIRWLRANAEKYGYDVARVGVGGASAGGHLSLLVGLSGGVKELEGDVGGHLDQSSRVDAVVDFFGPSALGLFARQSERLRRMEASKVFESASPATYISKDDPPVLIFHGDADNTVPLGQSEYLHKRLQEAGLESSLHVIEGAGHGGPKFNDDQQCALIRAFFAKHIKRGGAAGEGKQEGE